MSAALVIGFLLATLPAAQSENSPDGVLRAIYGFQIQIQHCGVLFAGEMPVEINLQAQRLQKLVGLDDAAARQLVKALYSDMRDQIDCGEIRANALPTAWKLIQSANRIP
jgi:hypothetical protein